MNITVSIPQRFEVRPIEGALGAEVVGIDLKSLNAETFAELKKAFLSHILLVFRNQALEPSDLVKVAKFFGTPITSKNLARHKAAESYATELYNLPPEITVTSNIKVDGKALGQLGDGEVTWHSDHSYNESPSAARMLYGQEVPVGGPDTSFTNQYAAFDQLSDQVKEQIHGKTIKQDNTFDLTKKLREGFDPNADIRHSPGVSHPIISTHHETGHNSIFLGRRNRAYVNGMELSESEALVDELWSHSTQPRFFYSHKWANGDLVVWDNRCTLHRRDPIDPNSRRLLYAAQVEGGRPYEAEDSLNRAPHPRFTLAKQD